MNLMEMLASVGGRLGILEKSAEPSREPETKIQTRSVTLAELSAEIRSEELHALAGLPAELSVPFEKIIETAGISTPQHGWTIDSLRRLLQSEEFKALNREAVQNRILEVLRREKVEVEELVKDAIARDQALDSFERAARLKLEERMAARQRHLCELEEKMLALEKERASMKSQMSADEQQWREWRKRKRLQEKDLAWTVGFLIDRPVITTDAED